MPMVSPDDSDRKTIDELVSEYRYHPEFRDIYVEGQWDVRLIRWILKERRLHDVALYDIDAVHIPFTMLTKYGLSEGKKQRVVALAYELQDKLSDIRQVTCISDRDYDHLLGNEYSSPLLLMTDFCCQESYLLNEHVFDKFITLVIRNYPFDSPRLIGELLPTLQELHLMRATNISLDFNMEWLPLNKCCDYKAHTLTFMEDVFIERYLSKNGKVSQRGQFLAKLDELRLRLLPDARHHVSKADLFFLLAEILPSYCKEQAFHHPEYIARSLSACLEVTHLSEEPMYKRLLARVME